jgi:phenylpropionate dioxygenase-like ring-hydroxylating dioxygenase large terminal subunit
VGDYVDFEIGDQSIVVVRTEHGLRAYFNACRHRGTRLVSGQGRIGEFRCPFHAWRWHLDGSLKYQAGGRGAIGFRRPRWARDRSALHGAEEETRSSSRDRPT